MGEKKRPTIAVMVGNSSTEYHAELLAGFRICAREEDVNLVFLTGPYVPQYCKDILSGSFAWDYTYQFHAVYDYVKFIKPDALIINYGSLAIFDQIPNVEEMVSRYLGIPCLLVGDRVENPDVPQLLNGSYKGMRQCVEHLVLCHGYKKIAFVGGPKRNFDSNERMRAYRDVLTENGIQVDEGMIVHGNYTEAVDEQVNYLLDTYPDIEAIAFANDTMAKGCYRICAARNLLVGHDIAITGFDDAELAKSLEPPLTSVAQSSFMYSFNAVQAALKLCRGEKAKTYEMDAIFRCRESCGCSGGRQKQAIKAFTSAQERKAYVDRRVEELTVELFLSIPYDQAIHKYQNVMTGYFDEVLAIVYEQKQDSAENLIRYIKKLCSHPLLPKRHLLEHIEQLLEELIAMSENEQQRRRLLNVIQTTEQWIYSEDVTALQSQIVSMNRKNWFIPSFAMDLMAENLDADECLRMVVRRLKSLNIKSAYLLYFDEAITNKKGTELKLPDEIYLHGYYNENEMVCYPENEWLCVDTLNGIAKILPEDKAHYYSTFVLFSGEEQYGIILCEMEQQDFIFMLICSMQLGTLHRVLNMKKHEKQMKKELEEKNRILSMISEYDDLSQLLNRRGFMEKAIPMLEESKGKNACLLFADIDHLKEINDSFGHAAGDFAIRTASEYLRSCLPANAIMARVGGDEFVAMIITEHKDSREILTKRIKKYAADFNAGCAQPFYVEMSVGIYNFVCEPEMDITEIIRKSDDILYEEKKRRRSSIKKAGAQIAADKDGEG